MAGKTAFWAKMKCPGIVHKPAINIWCSLYSIPQVKMHQGEAVTVPVHWTRAYISMGASCQNDKQQFAVCPGLIMMAIAVLSMILCAFVNGWQFTFFKYGIPNGCSFCGQYCCSLVFCGLPWIGADAPQSIDLFVAIGVCFPVVFCFWQVCCGGDFTLAVCRYDARIAAATSVWVTEPTPTTPQAPGGRKAANQQQAFGFKPPFASGRSRSTGSSESNSIGPKLKRPSDTDRKQVCKYVLSLFDCVYQYFGSLVVCIHCW